MCVCERERERERETERDRDRERQRQRETEREREKKNREREREWEGVLISRWERAGTEMRTQYLAAHKPSRLHHCLIRENIVFLLPNVFNLTIIT